MSRRLMEQGEAHYACPDKVPLQRLRTLERAGRARVPFTTGLLIGIGETFEELYAAWGAAEPDAGYETKTADVQARIEAAKAGAELAFSQSES